MKEYWNDRYKSGNKIWGDLPSASAVNACRLFKDYNIKTVLVPGCGYGRNAEYFAQKGLDVTGIEISDIAICLTNPSSLVKYHYGSILEISDRHAAYDAVFSYNTLHLFLLPERKRFVENCMNMLVPGGVIFTAVFSENDPGYGKGKMIEESTFESKPGRYAHYFSGNDLSGLFREFNIIDSGLIDEEEDHGDAGPHIHSIRYIFVKK